MFLNSLYKIREIITGDNRSKFSVVIELNPDHEIFKGHFPEIPILPGACMVQILKELLIYHSETQLILKNALSIKYLSFINPLENNVINVNIEMNINANDNISCNAVLSYESVVFCRFKGEFKVLTK
jgi:3-hydroxyacyl-[acyl-carrier-protein] dehydratase